MTDAASNEETDARLQALRRNGGPPAQAARILTAGIAGSMLLGMIGAMGWSDSRAATSQPVAQPPATTTTTTAAPNPVEATTPTPAVVPVATPVPTTVSISTAPPVAQTRQSD